MLSGKLRHPVQKQNYYTILYFTLNEQEMRTLELHEMEEIDGGSCGLAVAAGAISGAAIIATAIWAPYIWASPKTWYTAAGLVAANAGFIYDQCY